MDDNWQVIAAILAAAAAVLGLLYRYLSGREERITGLVERTVDAKIGATFVELSGLREEAIRHLRTTADEIRSETDRTLENFQQQAREAEETLSSVERLEELLSAARDVFPGLEAAAADSAGVLLERAKGSEDRREIQLLLDSLLRREDADATTLEIAGDTARDNLNDKSLAERLYVKALERNEHRVSARAELLSLRADVSGPAGDAAFRELRELAEQNDGDRSILTVFFDCCMRLSRFEDLRDFTSQRLSDNFDPSFYFRNYAVALSELDSDFEEAEQAYERALDLARARGDTGAVANAVKPLTGLLLAHDRATEARALLETTLRRMPTEWTLYSSYAESLRTEGMLRESLIWMEAAQHFAPLPVKPLIERERDGLVLLSQLLDQDSEEAPLDR